MQRVLSMTFAHLGADLDVPCDAVALGIASLDEVMSIAEAVRIRRDASKEQPSQRPALVTSVSLLSSRMSTVR